MSLSRREFLQMLAVGAAHGLPLSSQAASADEQSFYELRPAGNVTLLHFTDCHAQLLPSYFREPDVNLGMHDAHGKPPHLVGESLLKRFGIRPATRLAHAYTPIDFEQAARRFGKVGGFA